MSLQKTVYISGRAFHTNSFTQDINLEFQPTEVKILYAIKQDNENLGADIVITLRSDLIDNNILIAFPNVISYYQQLDIPFPLNKNINGSYTFEFLKYDGTKPGNIATFNTTISLCLLFIGNKKINHLS